MRRPKFIARQARDAQGLLGRLVAFVMAIETRGENLRAMEALGVAATDHVLDVGCGPGTGLQILSQQAPNGRALGVDSSQLMVQVAIRRNWKRVRAGQVAVEIATAGHLPFPDGVFDKVLCVHVVYFWNDMDAALREIARVLKPGGRLAMLFRTSADRGAMRAFPADVYRFPALPDVVASLERAGFRSDAARDGAGDHFDEAALVVATIAGRGTPG